MKKQIPSLWRSYVGRIRFPGLPPAKQAYVLSA